MNKGTYTALVNAQIISQLQPADQIPFHKPDCQECVEVKEVLESFEKRDGNNQ